VKGKSTTARGYGFHHQKLRRRWQAVVDRGEAVCSRCRSPIVAGQAWHLDHAPGKVAYLGPSHARCNAVAGAKLGAAITNAKRRGRLRGSRRW
jgi:hypothetical protein